MSRKAIIGILLLLAGCGGPRARVLKKYPVNMEYISRGKDCLEDSIYEVKLTTDGAAQRLKIVYENNTCPDFKPIWSVR